MSIVNGFGNVPSDTAYAVNRFNIPKIVEEPYSALTTFVRDLFPTSWNEVTAYTKYTSNNGYILSASSYYSSSNPVSNACDNSTTTYWRAGASKTSYIKMELPIPRKILKMKARVTASSTGYFTNAVIQGSHDDSTWTNLYTISAYQAEVTEMTLSNTDYYKYYRIYITTTSTSYTGVVYDWRCYTYEDYGDKYNYSLSVDCPFVYEPNKILNIQGISYTGHLDIMYSSNIIPTSWSNVGEGVFESDNGVILTSSTSSYDADVNNAFDGDSNTYWNIGNQININFLDKLAIKGMPIIINDLTIDRLSAAPESPAVDQIYYNTTDSKAYIYKESGWEETVYESAIYVEASNDNSEWKELYTSSFCGILNTTAELIDTSSAKYEYYRIRSDKNIGISNLQTNAYVKTYTGGTTTTLNNFYINVNGTGKKPINGTIRSGKYYNLMWTGAEWIAQVTTLGVSTDQIVITSSGTYTIDPDISYNLIAIGGGGGGALTYCSYYSDYLAAGGGGSAGKIEDVFTPTSDTITVTVGAAGTNRVVTDNPGSATGGGDTKIGNFIAYGGEPGTTTANTSEDYASAKGGAGGSYSGGNGYSGKSGTMGGTVTGSFSSTGGAGWTINGVTYGQGGAYKGNQSSYSVVSTPTAGVIILTPII